MKRTIMTFIGCVVIYGVSAQQSYTLKSCLEIGLEQNYSIRMIRNEEQVSKNNVTLGNAGYLPTLDLKGGYNLTEGNSNTEPGKGNTVASVDELYLFLTNMTAIEYIRNCMKRVRKKNSSVVLASQNIEDFLIPSIREFTKPLFSIPTHHFLFNAGQINPKEYMDALQVEPSEFELIKYPERGTCLYRCGNERYLLQVKAPDYKAALFGKAGGR